MSADSPTVSGSYWVTLDGWSVTVPEGIRGSLSGIMDYLRGIAVSQNRALISLRLDSRRKNSDRRHIAVRTAAFGTLGFELIDRMEAQARGLIERLGRDQVLVLVNDWSFARSLWDDLLPAMRRPMVDLQVLAELWGPACERVSVEGVRLSRHCHQAGVIRARVEVQLMRKRNIVSFSNLLEGEVTRWLRRFMEFMKVLRLAGGPA